MNKNLKTFLHLLLLLACSVIAGYLMLVIVCFIPQGRLLKGIGNSVAAIRKDDGDLSEVIFGYPGSRLDVFTDGAMLNAALYTGDENPFYRAISCRQYTYKGRSPAQALMDYFVPIEPDTEVPHVRYWHGFLVLLKPLLLFFNYSDIRMINQMGQLIVVSAVLCALARRKLHRYIPAVLMTYFFLTPIVLPMALQYSSVFYAGFGSLAVLLMFYDRLKDKEGMLYLFLFTGILTSYLDLLTYPVFSLGIPIVGLLILRSREREDKDFLSMFKEFTACGFTWFLGYAGMWAAKTIIAIPFYGFGEVRGTLDNVAKRSVSGAASEGCTFGQAVRDNLFMYKNSIFAVSLVLYTLCVIAYNIYCLARNKARISLKTVLMFICVALIPFVWYFVTVEHACVHAFMTYKNLAVTVFAYCAGLVSVAWHGRGLETDE